MYLQKTNKEIKPYLSFFDLTLDILNLEVEVHFNVLVFYDLMNLTLHI